MSKALQTWAANHTKVQVTSMCTILTFCQNTSFTMAQNAHDSRSKIPEMFEASIEGKLKALWLMGEDVVQTDPNTQKSSKPCRT